MHIAVACAHGAEGVIKSTFLARQGSFPNANRPAHLESRAPKTSWRCETSCWKHSMPLPFAEKDATKYLPGSIKLYQAVRQCAGEKQSTVCLDDPRLIRLAHDAVDGVFCATTRTQCIVRRSFKQRFKFQNAFAAVTTWLGNCLLPVACRIYGYPTCSQRVAVFGALCPGVDSSYIGAGRRFSKLPKGFLPCR